MITDFIRLQPPVFTGEGDPMIAEKWLDQIVKCIEALKVVDDETYIQLATFQFRDSADTWWKSVKDTKDTAVMTWVDFRELFLAQYFPQIVQDAKLNEFMNLLQGTSTVTEYETQFTALSKFGKDFIKTGYAKCRRFEFGLQPTIRQYVVPLRHNDYSALVDAALSSEKERIDTGKITDRSRQMRAGATSLAQQQIGRAHV